MPTPPTGVSCQHVTEVWNQLDLLGVAEALTLPVAALIAS
jgi:hypothetical protein